MRGIKHFHHCPKCGQALGKHSHPNFIECPACQFVYYFNPTVSAAGIAMDEQDRVLFIRRAKDPAKGKLAIPGGFIDMGETAEAGLRREFREEVKVELLHLEYFFSTHNEYLYKGVTYPVLDLYFTARAQDPKTATALDDVESLCWLKPEEIPLAEIAFPSMREALEQWMAELAERKLCQAGK